ncbi:MAG: ATP-binding cassette domain-containing protein [Candidatus Eisenbacteria bacterium]
MALLALNEVSLKFAGPALLDRVNVSIEPGERLGLLGRNGAGKSTLLKVLQGSLLPDSGEVVRQPRLKVASLQQDVPSDLAGTVRDYLHVACGANTSETAWEIERHIDQATNDLRLDLDSAIETLSAGSKRRVLLAAALVRDPDLLLLDEPTNHLDIDAIRHLENALQRRRGTLVFVTHDRSFLRTLATRILDVDRGAVRSYPGSYDTYLERRDDVLRVEAEQAALFDKKLAQEEVWLRRGIKARRTRNEGRVRALEALRLERRARRDEVGRVKAQLFESERSGRMVLRCQDVSYDYGQGLIVDGLTTTIMRGDRIGILGPNGCGKTTLIGLLLGERAPQRGTVTPGTKLEVARFDQLHEALDESKTVVGNIAEGREMITMGTGERHVVGYLRDFLFTPEQIQGPINRLSGGERRRLQLAKILSRPCNVLVLDEPTNDLDLETLDLLEDMLIEYQGTLLVVSHDRAFLDNVVSSTLVFEGEGQWREYVGGYEDWLRQKPEESPALALKPGRSAPARAGAREKRMSFKDKRELTELPARIEVLEAERRALYLVLASPEIYSSRTGKVAPAQKRVAAIDEEIHAAYARWMALEALATSEPT